MSSLASVLSTVFPFEGVGECHQLMHENRHPAGNMAILVNATKQGETTLKVDQMRSRPEVIDRESQTRTSRSSLMATAAF